MTSQKISLWRDKDSNTMISHEHGDPTLVPSILGLVREPIQSLYLLNTNNTGVTSLLRGVGGLIK